jgi:lipid II:glycine glycyltransferase (peptidoglycan interpeptide bridge formation enzyme)
LNDPRLTQPDTAGKIPVIFCRAYREQPLLKSLPPNWNQLIRNLPATHVLQSADWGEFKRRSTGWTPEALTFSTQGNLRGAALTLTRRIGPFAVMYIPQRADARLC